MFELIKDYIKQKITVLNSSFSTPLQINQVMSRLDPKSKPTSERALHYAVMIEDTDDNDVVSRVNDLFSVRIDLEFLTGGKDKEFYTKMFDSYVWGLRKALSKNATDCYLPYVNSAISTSGTINGINDIRITNADLFEGNYYMPSIRVTFLIMDSE